MRLAVLLILLLVQLHAEEKCLFTQESIDIEYKALLLHEKCEDEAMMSLAKKAEQGNALAYYYLGTIFEKESDTKIALKMYEKSIALFEHNNTNIALPLHNLGMLYLENNATYEQGIVTLQKAASYGFHKSSYSLLVALNNTKRAYSHAVLKKQLDLAKKLLDDKKYRPEMLVFIGRVESATYCQISPDTCNEEEALKFSLEAANEYHMTEAYANLSTIYAYGATVKHDENLSRFWKIKYYSDGYQKILELGY